MTPWSFAGRAQELERVRDLVRGKGGGVVLAGPPGVGKTRLALEGLALAERAGLATERVTATRSAGELPFGAFAPLLAGDAPDGPAVDDAADLLRRSARALVDRAGGRRLVLLVDDAHLLDGSSATLVHQLVATGAATVVATVASGEPAPDPIAALWKDGLAERIDLAGLSPRAVAALLTANLGAPVDAATVVALADRSEGNVLFLRELVIGAQDDGSLIDDGGLWRLVGPLLPSARLSELIETRLGGLDEAERDVLELVAYGEPLGQAELTALADSEVAERLERRSLLASRMHGRRLEVWVAHPLYGDVTRARTPALRQRRIARELAEVVEATGRRRRYDALRVATWYLAGGGGRPDVLLAGAQAARWRYDFPLAERLARAAIEAGAGFEAAGLAAEVAGLQGRVEEADREMAALAEQATDDDERGAIAVARFDNGFVWQRGDALGFLEDSERAIADPGWHAELEARRLAVLTNSQGPAATVAAAEPFLREATGAPLAMGSISAAYAQARNGRIADALATTERGRAVRETLTMPLVWYPWWHDVVRFHALWYAGRLAEADAIVQDGYRRALRDRSSEAQAMFAESWAAPVGERGGAHTAVRRAREAIALHEQLRRPLLTRLDRVMCVLALALAGDADGAATELAELDAHGPPFGHVEHGDLAQARAWAAAAGGDLPGARGYLERAADLAADVGDVVGEAAALHGLARLGRAPQASARLADVATRIEGDLAPARAAHAEALAHGDATGLEKVSRSFEAMGADLLAAESAADAAVARRRAGEAREAAADQRRAGLLAARCEDPVTPALQAIEVRARLTPAERETAVLASSGRSNTEIADQLFLSRRTVENRLHRVYEKLGISGRDELAEALAPDDPGA